MDLELGGKVAIVTGASRGIGRAIAQLLSAEGMRVVLAARSADPLREVAASLRGESLVQALDLREPEAPAALVAATLARFGRIDALVNNAGATVRGDFLALTDPQWQDGFALKFHAAMRNSSASPSR
jgi:NAD(P)-dependent dehydrogenase (short-subunit alcohol dehydrogenase family)